MIPLYDNVPRVHPPLVTLGIIAVNVLVFLFQSSMADGGETMLWLHGAIPLRLLDGGWAAEYGFPGGAIFTTVTYMFLHADTLHLLMNMWMMWIFADNIEDVTGHGGLAVFYLLCGIIALAMHMAFNGGSAVPIIGASGAVAGIMGAYFVLYPHGRVATFVFIFIVHLPATVFLGLWFMMQVVAGLSQASEGAAGIAWWAHVGGFVAGMALIRLFVKKGRCYYCYNSDKKYYDLTGDDTPAP